MSLEKPKKQTPRRNRLVFLLLWLVGHGAAWGVLFTVIEALFVSSSNDFVAFTIFGIILGFITSLTQYLLIRWQFGRNIRWWIPVSILAWVFATLVPFMYLTENVSGSDQITILLQALGLYAPAAIAQVFLLRRHVQQAWLWALASVAGTSVFAMSVSQFDNGGVWAAIISYGLYACATGLTLLWLFGMSQTPENLKDASAAIEHLTDKQSSENPTSEGLESDYQAHYHAK